MAKARERAILGLLVFAFIVGLGLLAALVPVGHGFTPKGGGWFTPAVVGGAFTLHPLFIAVPAAACFVLGLLDWRHPWRVEHLDLLALAGFFPVAMLLSDDLSRVGLWLAASCLGWLFARMVGACHGAWRMPGLRPSVSSQWLGPAVLVLLLVRIGSVPASWMSGRRARSAPGACCTACIFTEQYPGRAQAGSGYSARTPTARLPTTHTSRSRPSSRRRLPKSRPCCQRCASTC